MTTLCRPSAVLMLAGLSFAVVLAPFALARTPYDAIVERNPFGLKPPAPATTETNATTATPPSKVVLTGITSMFGPNSKRVFLEITEQQEGGAKGTPAPPKRPMLGEGDREGDVEVVSIDMERNIVKIKVGAIESELTFEEPKQSASGGSAANVASNSRGATPAPSASPSSGGNEPIIVSSSESRGGVTMAGGGSAFQGNTAGVTSYGGTTPMNSGNAGGISSYGGISPTGYGAPGGPVTPALASAGLPTIPARTIRTPTTPAAQTVDPQTQILLMEANRIRNDQINQGVGGRPGVRMPPLPPTALSRELYGGGPPPLPVQQ